ncbi:Aldo/keto reductase [Mollisia scopiformis]|uniref:Aldo/keto reductase n=1 Tax=Mollisia scopiformis TaxID=149040 RepID=A0A132B4M5_MOLSC|nr:Aldo/keto reductase [Mollisia scopiformis]KUJ06949.1 Aldo/keto reductase [Mollisia scopiformis]
MTTSSPYLIFGVGYWNNEPSSLQKQQELLSICRKYGIKAFDTARHYGHGESEKFLGNEGLASSGEFEIITKAAMGLTPEGATKEGIIKGWVESSEALKTEKVATYLLHVPNPSTPISSTMDGIQALYLAGHFDEFGISNFTPAQVLELHTYATSHSYILPTVYQSIYSLCSRLNEVHLFPLLRRLNIKIQAYSCLGSGFLVKTPAQIRSNSGAFDPSTVLGKILHEIYGKPNFLQFLEEYRALCEEMGERPAGVAYRWVVWNSGLDVERGDQVVVGASGARQLEETILEIRKGKLEGWVCERLDAMWKKVEAEAPGDNFTTFKKLMDAGLL